MSQLNLDTLKRILYACYSKETAYPSCQKDWVPDDPTYGQCAVTAMIVHDYFGGTIHRIRVDGGGTHYFNKIDGKITPAADFAHNFRTSLLAEHLGLKPDDNILFDPLSDELWEKLNNTAKINTEIYRKLWNCYPDDNMKKFTDLKEVKKINELNEKEMNKLKNLYNIEKVNTYIDNDRETLNKISYYFNKDRKIFSFFSYI